MMDKTIENNVKDLVAKFLYYDRKEDEDLELGEIERQLDNGELTVDEIVSVFRTELEKNV